MILNLRVNTSHYQPSTPKTHNQLYLLNKLFGTLSAIQELQRRRYHNGTKKNRNEPHPTYIGNLW
ncbi:hypothetical protein THOB06_60128 [Vibrio rotiferianus]|nr:hypothetical protein THOG10_60128 [Vibrio rotiferianus]CAH1593535.1 hypothetical protein THOB06_60128 [Vibrio rotiferianus]